MKKEVNPVLPKSITLFDEITIVKKCKGDYRAEVKLNGQKYYLINRFKSITKANEWKAVHLKV